MKNTMKKLLCMALVIMLLVSAVPAFAMAEELPDDGMNHVDGVDNFVDAVGNSDDTVYYNDGQDTTTDYVSADGTQEGNATKVYAYLYTGEAKYSEGTLTSISRAGDAGSWSSSNISSTVSLETILYTYLKQASRDANGIAAYQKYDYYVQVRKTAKFGDVNAEGATWEVPNLDETVGEKSEEGTVYVHFVRIPKKVTVTLELEDSDFRANPYEVTIYTVLDLPKAFAQNGLKADSGKYICSYTLEGSTNPLGTTYRVSEDVTIVGHQDLLINKAENDKNGVGSSTGTTTGGSSGNSSANGSTGSNKFPYPVYLNIYKDTLVGSPDKRVEITKGAALDGTVTLSEVKNVVKNYYTAKDSDGISYDGLYIAEGNWVADYVADTAKYDSIDAGTMRQTGTVYINVMIGNAKAKSSSTADASNPKTGDAIFVPMMVMGLTGTALAAAYVFGKKRIAR